MGQRSTSICVIGDAALVDEYTSLASGKGFRCVASPAASAFLALELTNIAAEDKKKNLRRLDKALHKRIPIISSSTTITVAEQSTWVTSPERLVGIGALPTLLRGALLEFAATPATNDSAKTAAREFAAALGKECAFVDDSAGMVLPRILCMLVNEACFAMGEAVATANDIDTAMKLGTSYPRGPMAWGAEIGVRHVHAVVAALYRHFGDDRYRTAPLLQAAAFRGTW